MTEFGMDEPVEDALEQRATVDPDEPAVTHLEPVGDREASDADVVEQQLEVPAEDDPV
ncbi:hypothetical protein ACFQ1S_03770 [Kibdelosporangium lantanae]|uniref:DUF5709 domain-containing protein n=1 Tax=Kibdelosporangium lantanae TaxID=1497396 RepID=A0ABW3M269_9PSEU